jgi:hypothetical protein
MHRSPSEEDEENVEISLLEFGTTITKTIEESCENSFFHHSNNETTAVQRAAWGRRRDGWVVNTGGKEERGGSHQ